MVEKLLVQSSGAKSSHFGSSSSLGPEGVANTAEILRAKLEKKWVTLFALPSKPRPLTNVSSLNKVRQVFNDLNPKEIEVLEKSEAKDVKTLIESYPISQQERMALLADQIRQNSTVSNPTRVFAYFYGPPGTGKTRFAKELAKSLGVHLCKLNISKVTSDFLLGVSQPVRVPDLLKRQGDAKVAANGGVILECLREAGHSNPIIFFDEVGEFLGDDEGIVRDQEKVSELKKILDPEEKNFDIPSLKIKVDLSRVTILMAGNSPINEKGLRNRMPQIDFPRLERKEKFAALAERLESLQESYPSECLNEAKTYFELLLDLDHSPGARIIQSLLDHLCWYLQQGSSGTVKKGEIEEFIKKRLAEYDPAVGTSLDPNTGSTASSIQAEEVHPFEKQKLSLSKKLSKLFKKS